MELRKAELKKTPEQHKDDHKSRFQIVKLEKRIAPGCLHHNGNGHGHFGGGCG